MATEQTANEGGKTAKEKTEIVYRMDAKEIPQGIREVVAEKIGAKADIYPARNDGGYKGPVIHADKDFVVQAIGRNQHSAVIHKRSDIELQGAALVSRDANNDLPGRNLQVHYRGSDQPGKAYPWNAELEAKKRSDDAEKRVSPSDKVVEAAQKYAESSISKPKEREAFLAHVANVAKEAFPSREKAADKPAKAAEKPAPQRGKQDRQPEPALER